MKLKITLLLTSVLVMVFSIWYFSYSPSCDGIDVSHYNTINESTEGIDQINFIIAKATEGSDHIDTKYLKHKKYAYENGIKFGAYHFLSKISPIADQFENYKRVVGKDIDIIPCLDIEQINGKHWGRGEARKAVKEWSTLCLDYYGKYPIIYCNDFYRIFYFSDMLNQFWISNWHTRPFTKCAIHQYSNNDETIDHNHLLTDLENICLTK
ncbi:MAG: hypothetical protein K2H60_14710 [Muribaculaceae bacterium]|nr:hypothetical protein [Muribaculaceae bacterium]